MKGASSMYWGFLMFAAGMVWAVNNGAAPAIQFIGAMVALIGFWVFLFGGSSLNSTLQAMEKRLNNLEEKACPKEEARKS